MGLGEGWDGNNTLPYGNCDHHLCTAWVGGFLWLCLIKLWSEYACLHDSFDCPVRILWCVHVYSTLGSGTFVLRKLLFAQRETSGESARLIVVPIV